MDHRADRDLWRGREVLRLLELVSSERRVFQEILASLPIPIAVVRSDGELRTSNRAFRALFQLPRGESNPTIDDVVTSPELRRAIGAAPAGVTSEVDVTGISPEILTVSVTPLRVFDEDAPGEALLTFRISAAQIAPPAMPQPGPSGIPAEVPAVVWTMDPESLRFTSLSGDADSVLGAPREHWLEDGVAASERVHPSERQAVGALYRQAIAAGGQFSCEFRGISNTKKEKWIHDSFRVLRGADGRTRIVGVTIDVTGRRTAYEHSTLAHRADALAGISRRLTHDLNNALMIIGGYGEELLAQLADDDPRRNDVQSLMSAAETIAAIAGELQGFGRTQAAAKSEIAVGDVLEAASARIRSQLGAVLVTRVLDHTLTAIGDAAQLEAILISVARALRHATDPHLILSASRVRIADYAGTPLGPEPGQYVEIVFRAPVESALDSRAFENLLAGRDRHGSNLSRAYAVIREWDGWIRAAQTEHSAEVRLLLRDASDSLTEQEAAPAVAAVTVPDAPPEPAPKAETILVVEDEQGIRTLVRRILDREGYRVLDAGTAEEASDTVRRSNAPIDLLITDVQLPGESGRELAERLQASMPHLRAVYMSGYSDDPVLQAATSGPAILQKPFTRSVLLKRVKDALAAGN